jgi:FkbM family methyltransferase
MIAMSRVKQAAKRAIQAVSKVRAHWKDELYVHFDNLLLRYATRSPVAKRWFYPRYTNGQRMHEPPISALIRSELDPDSVFFDVGANVGFFTVLGAKVCSASEGEVHAFELDPTLIPLIRESLCLNEDRAPVYLNCVACADEPGNFYTFQAAQENNPSTNQITVDEETRSGRDHVQAVTMTLDRYWRRTGATPELIKMDLEGADALADHGMLDLISEHTPKLILEVHPEAVRQFGENPKSIVEKLREAGGYEKVVRVRSYRSGFEQQSNRLVPLETGAFADDHPIVLFYTSDPVEDIFRA